MSSTRDKVGFMQGRLSPMVGDRIQAFPEECWRDEFRIAASNHFKLMEWTLDQSSLHENPLLTPRGRDEIMLLSAQYDLAIPSVTGDCFMQAPFWKAAAAERDSLEKDFLAVVAALAAVGASVLVVPLVDNGRLENKEQEERLIGYLQGWHAGEAEKHNVTIAFESDFGPEELARFIEPLDPSRFGINYDIGNSASTGFDPDDEFQAYMQRIVSVHVKDRLFGGTTVPLGQGAADLPKVFSLLNQAGYDGNYILQTARASDGNHAVVLSRYRDMAAKWIDLDAA